LRSALAQLVYRLDAGLGAMPQALAVKVLAARAAHLVGHKAQHVHGGMGVDITYPIHRYLYWSRALAASLGGAAPALERLGDWLADRRPPGLEVRPARRPRAPQPEPRHALDDITVGQALPKLPIPITVPLIAGGAIATRDYFPGHHDLDAARALGSPHIFMNILTTSALVQRYRRSNGPARTASSRP
jgi:hypothetical protein